MQTWADYLDELREGRVVLSLAASSSKSAAEWVAQ
jgi:hypothetical protein